MFCLRKFKRPSLKFKQLSVNLSSNNVKEVDISKIRNIGILAHIDAGRMSISYLKVII